MSNLYYVKAYDLEFVGTHGFKEIDVVEIYLKAETETEAYIKARKLKLFKRQQYLPRKLRVSLNKQPREIKRW